MGVLDRLRELSVAPRQRLSRELREVYRDERQLGRQLRTHAARAPYPAVGTELLRLADQADASAATLAHALRDLMGGADPHVPDAPPAGRNLWERLNRDLHDAESLLRRYTELSLRWDADFPAIAATFDRLARTASATLGTLRSLAARSDPHAVN